MKYLIRAVTNGHFFPLLLVLMFAVLASRTLIFQSGYLNMHDDLQLMRLLQLEKCFLDWQIPCRWVPDMGYGFGFPLFNFYPPLPYLIGEIIRITGVSFITTAKLTFAFSIIVSGVMMYLLTKEFFGRIGATLSSIFYVWAPYHAVDVYVRGAMNEAWALAWFPLIFWAGYRLIISKNKFDIKWIVVLTLSWFALLTSHNLMVMMFTPAFAAWVLIWLWLKSRWRKIPQLALSGIWAFGLAAFFTFPALLENKFTQIKGQLIGYYDYTAHFVSIKQLLFSRFWGYGPSVWVDAEDGMSFQIGHVHWILAIVVGIGVFSKLFYHLVKTEKKINELKKHPVLIILTFLFIVGWSSAFLTHARSTPIWMALPQMGFIQFPWRFLTLVIFSFSFLIGALPGAMAKIKTSHGILTKILLTPFQLFLLISLAVFLVIFNWKYFLPEHGKMGPLTDQEKLSGAAWELQRTAGIYDYLPSTSEMAPQSGREELAEVMQGEVIVSNESEGTNWAEFRANVDSDESTLRIGILDFPGWTALTDNKQIKKYIAEDEKWGRMYIDLPEGVHNVRIEFRNTPVRSVSNAVSLFSLSALIIVLFKYNYLRENLA